MNTEQCTDKNSVQTSTVEKMMIYMNQEMEITDAEWKKNHKKKDHPKDGNISQYG